jgi:hypothetical protein
MIARLRQWLAKRRLDRAQALIEGYGLSIVVKLRQVAGTTYLVNADGTCLKLQKVVKK